MTLIAGVVGWPIAHSLSPLIHGAWIKAAGLDARYEAFEAGDEPAFRRLVNEGRDGRLVGLNVTAPWKELALALADTASLTARQCGSANLIGFAEGRIVATSTDGLGLMAALIEQAPDFDARGADVVVLGAGGAARAAVAALVRDGARVGVMNRTRERAERLAEDLGAEVAEETALERAALVVNALSGPPEIEVEALRADAVLMDMTYRPLLTPFLQAGRARGLTVVDGLAMLIGQARPSFRALFGVEPPAVDVRALALDALGETA